MYSAAASFLSKEMAPRLFILGRERYGESTLLLCRLLAKVSPFEGRGEAERQKEGACAFLSCSSSPPQWISEVSSAALREKTSGGCGAGVEQMGVATTSAI